MVLQPKHSLAAIQERTAGLLFLFFASVGGVLLFSLWDVWFGYPNDWDVTAMGALCLQAGVVYFLCALPPRRAAFALGALIPIQGYLMLLFSARWLHAT